MLNIKLSGLEELERQLDLKKVDIFQRNIQNDVAFEVMSAEKKSIKEVFPTANPRTLKNIFVKKATKDSPHTQVRFDQIYRGEGIDEYMRPHVEGGKRGMKRSEKRLKQFYVPGKGARLDQYGNMRGGQVTQILSQLKRFGDRTGYDMNETAASRQRRSGRSKTTEYFIVRRPRGGLKPGVYQRVQTGVGFGAKTSRSMAAGAFQKGASVGKFSSVIRARGVSPVMVFTKGTPGYRAVWPFFKIAQDVVDKKLPEIAGRWFAKLYFKG